MGTGGAVGLPTSTPGQIVQLIQAAQENQTTLNAILTFLSGILLAVIAWVGRTVILHFTGRNKVTEIAATKDKEVDEAWTAAQTQIEIKASTRLFNLVGEMQRTIGEMQKQNTAQASRIAVLEAALADRDKQIEALRNELIALRKRLFIGEDEIIHQKDPAEGQEKVDG